MPVDLLRSPTQLSYTEALQASQQAPSILENDTSWGLPWPLSLLITSDAPEKWAIYENLLLSCLRTGDNKSALACLEKLKARFGEQNERVSGLMGLYHEALAPDDITLETILDQYDTKIEDAPTNMAVRKRQVNVLKSLSRPTEAILSLVELLEQSPADAEAWAELSELYSAQGMYKQAVFCLEEVLLIMPNAWNMHAHYGAMIYMYASKPGTTDAVAVRSLSHAMRRYCRSVELSDDYLRGYYGLKLTTSTLLKILPQSGSKELAEDDLPIPSIRLVQQLNELATKKLAEIVRKASTAGSDWGGYEQSEVIASRALLDLDQTSQIR